MRDSARREGCKRNSATAKTGWKHAYPPKAVNLQQLEHRLHLTTKLIGGQLHCLIL